MNKTINILGIETSCDETAAAIVRGGLGKSGELLNIEVLSDIVSSQIDIHKKWGGVVPEVAAREHVGQILPVLDEALLKAGFKKEKAKEEIDTIAVTVGPGLITSLLIGVETAKSLSFAWQKPVYGINHIEGHIYANFIARQDKIVFPALILTVSGGHTLLALMKGHGNIKTIGETRDDAAGEAFDKAAQLLGIGYPGGPAIAAQAELFGNSGQKNPPGAIKLPRPMINSQELDFSFSGLKTALRYALENDKHWKKHISAYAHEFQQAVVDTLIHKTIKAAQKHQVKNILLSGGVSANRTLREEMKKEINDKISDCNFYMPDLKYTTDNAAMIAAAGLFAHLKERSSNWKKLRVNCTLEL